MTADETPNAHDDTGRTATVRLIPDMDDEILHSLHWLSEVLTGWDAADLEDGEEFEDPEEAAAAHAAEAAIDRIIAAIRPTQTDPRVPSEIRVDDRWVPQSTAPAGYAGRLLAADGQFEFGPIRLVDVAEDDITTVAAICGRLLDDRARGPLFYVAQLVAAGWDNSPIDINDGPAGGADYARRVLGVMVVLERTPATDANARILVDALAGHDPNADLVLTVSQSAAYQRWVTDTTRDLGLGALSRMARAGFSY